MNSLLLDLRYAIRMLLKNQSLTAVALFALALGIGANTAIFSVVNAVILRSLPYPDAGRLVMVWKMWHPPSKSLTSPGEFLDWRERNDVFEGIAAFEDPYVSNRATFDLTSGDIPERVWGARVSANLFSVLGVQLALGRAFLPEEEQAGGHRVAIISDGLWKRRFGSDPGVIGSNVGINGEGYTIVGVMPAEFKLTYPRRSDLLVPIPFSNLLPKDPAKRDSFNIAYRANREFISYKTIARLKPGVTIAQAQAGMSALSAALQREYPSTIPDTDVMVTAMHDEVVGRTSGLFVVLIGAVVFVLLIACANVANLMLARAIDRTKEIAIRAALGSSRLRLIQQLLVESIVLSVTGGLLGLLLAIWGTGRLVTLIPSDVPRIDEVSADLRVLAFTLVVSVATGVLLGLLPALQASKPDLNMALKEGAGSATSGPRSGRTRQVFVIAQLSLTVLLLIGAGLLINSLWRLGKVDLGFEPRRVLTAQTTLSYPKYSKPEAKRLFVDTLLPRISSLPGVTSVSAANSMPLRGPDFISRFTIEGRQSEAAGGGLLPALDWAVQNRAVQGDYFTLLGIPILKGRPFSEQDSTNAPRVAIINEAMARKFFPGEDPTGKRLNVNSSEEIVGIAGDVRHSSVSREAEPAVYIPLAQQFDRYLIRLMVKTSSEPTDLAAAIQREVAAIDKDLPIDDVLTFDEIVSFSTSITRFYSIMLSVFAAVALALAAIGIYGLMSYSVKGRTREIGIRIALGADQGRILWLVVGQGIVLTGLGLGIGVAAAFGATRLLSTFLYGVGATDPPTFAAVSLLLGSVALLACYLPARRASRVDPMAALRYE